MNEWKEKINLNFYYGLIFLLSLVVLFVAPMFSPYTNSDAEIGLDIPNTPIGWAIYVVTKLFVACVNLLLFHCFVKQARLNILENENYKNACDILKKYLPKQYHPRSEKEYFRQLYRKKGILIFVTSVLSSVVLTNAILSFDLTSFITYSITILMGLILGVMKMKDVESYWTGEFYDYAINYEKEMESNGIHL